MNFNSLSYFAYRIVGLVMAGTSDLTETQALNALMTWSNGRHTPSEVVAAYIAAEIQHLEEQALGEGDE